MRLMCIAAIIGVVLGAGLHSGLHRCNKFVVKQCRLIIYLINLIY